MKDINDKSVENQKGSLIKDEFVTIKKSSQVPGSKTDETLVTFDRVYLLVSTEVTTSN